MHMDENGRTKMKTMNIEKQLQIDREVSSIEKLTVSEGLQYKKEEDGIRAIGPLYLIGSYSDAEGSPVMIRELIDMDVFAPAEKLSEEEFHIDIGEVQAQPQGHQIDVVIELQISGIKEGVFNKIVARASLTHSPITIELAENVINEFISKKEKVISSDYIQRYV